ncbi:MAG: F0F1 ATP synthase subunit delta [Pseudomonadales bacterium]|jgi:F-type H+-transporting ATPase subunit delta|nr:F0F1 ATP synthase subunit delta [Pseudomonadales bacterium]
MAEAATAARPYARAAFEYALAGKVLGAWSSFLQSARLAVLDERVAPLIGNPHVAMRELVELIGAVSLAAPAAAAVGEHGGNFLQLLAANGRLRLLPQIAEQFELLRAEQENTVDVELVSAVPLSVEQQQRFTAALTKRLARTVRLHLSVDPSLLGGAVVRAGDLVIDGSLRGRVARLSSAIAR